MRNLVLVAVAAAGLTVAGQAEAAVYCFDMTGLTYAPDHVGHPNGESIIGGVSGSIAIDESRYPGGKIANTVMTLTAVYYTGIGEPPDPSTAVIEGSKVAFSYSFYPTRNYIDWSFAGVTNYNFSPLLMPVYGTSSLRLEFDDKGQVSKWSGHETTGGSGDYAFWGPDGWDETIEWVSQFQDISDMDYQVGGWTRTTIVADPSPVPLPAAAPMLLTGTMALFALKRKKSKRSQF